MTGPANGDGLPDLRRWWSAPVAVAGIAAAAVSIALARPSSFVAPRLPDTLDLGAGRVATPHAPTPSKAHSAHQAAHGGRTGSTSLAAVLVARPVLEVSVIGAATARPQTASTGAAPAADGAPSPVPAPVAPPEGESPDPVPPVASSPQPAPGGWSESPSTSTNGTDSADISERSGFSEPAVGGDG